MCRDRLWPPRWQLEYQLRDLSRAVRILLMLQAALCKQVAAQIYALNVVLSPAGYAAASEGESRQIAEIAKAITPMDVRCQLAARHIEAASALAASCPALPHIVHAIGCSFMAYSGQMTDLRCLSLNFMQTHAYIATTLVPRVHHNAVALCSQQIAAHVCVQQPRAWEAWVASSKTLPPCFFSFATPHANQVLQRALQHAMKSVAQQEGMDFAVRATGSMRAHLFAHCKASLAHFCAQVSSDTGASCASVPFHAA